jgi:hypothetical protein
MAPDSPLLSPPPNLPTTVAELPTDPASTGADVAAASNSTVDANDNDRPPLRRRMDNKIAPPLPAANHLVSGADAKAGISRSVPQGVATSAPSTSNPTQTG